eukprot:1517351-Pyramimonas_sp.AAC.1
MIKIRADRPPTDLSARFRGVREALASLPSGKGPLGRLPLCFEMARKAQLCEGVSRTFLSRKTFTTN